MALNKKYANLPDLVSFCHLAWWLLLTALTVYLTLKDPSPDIYETPDLTDEASTVPVSVIRHIYIHMTRLV